MKTGALVASLLVVPMLVLSAWALTGSQGAVEPQGSTILADPPDYTDGYGYDPQTGVMQDTNGFRYSYLPDGIVRLDLPWGYTTHFSFGLTADYQGSPEKRTALDYAWAWDTSIGVAVNESGNTTGYTYTFTADNQDGILDWTICLEFSPTSRMKVTHTLENDYADDLTNVKFWWLFDLTGTPEPYSIETSDGMVEGPLYAPIPDGIHWVRLANQFQFDWRDALIEYDNGHAYIGDGSVVGLDGTPILGISIELGDIAPGATIIVDPYFSGLEKTWDAAGDSSASIPASWDPNGALAAGDNVTFDATSVTNCDWNVEITLGNFSMLTGYSGTVTQNADFGFVDWVMQEGIYLTTPGFAATCIGNFTHIAGTLADQNMHLIMVGVGNTATLSIFGVETLHISNDTTVSSSGAFTQVLRGTLTVDLGVTMTVDAGKTLYVYFGGATTFENHGTIAGNVLVLECQAATQDVDYPGNITATHAQIINSAGAGQSAVMNLNSGLVVSSTFQIYSNHATHTITIDSSASIEVESFASVVLGNRGNIDQENIEWSFTDYSQTGVDSVFTQSAALTVGGDFTVSAGEFVNNGSAITVAGDWDTDGYTHGDNVVTLTGASKTLDMAATESFYNITVSGTYTMDADTTVDLRATITGTMSGAGDFIEPLPEFTNEGWPHACPHELYEHTVTQTYWDTLAIYDGPYWLHVVDGAITGVPNENDTGVHLISLTLTWNDMAVYQNYTIIVCPELLSEAEQTILGVVLSLALGFGLLAIGIMRAEPTMIVFSGLVWVFAGIVVYKDINLGWTILSMCLGMLFLWTGCLQIGKDGES